MISIDEYTLLFVGQHLKYSVKNDVGVVQFDSPGKVC